MMCTLYASAPEGPWTCSLGILRSDRIHPIPMDQIPSINSTCTPYSWNRHALNVGDIDMQYLPQAVLVAKAQYPR